jgi:hypothetical protein
MNRNNADAKGEKSLTSRHQTHTPHQSLDRSRLDFLLSLHLIRLRSTDDFRNGSYFKRLRRSKNLLVTAFPGEIVRDEDQREDEERP